MSHYNLPQGINSCLTINEAACEQCYENGITQYMTGQGNISDRNLCVKQYKAYLEKKIQFEKAPLKTGPLPSFHCPFHTRVLGGYCPLYKCYLVQDVLKWKKWPNGPSPPLKITSEHLTPPITTMTPIPAITTTPATTTLTSVAMMAESNYHGEFSTLLMLF